MSYAPTIIPRRVENKRPNFTRIADLGLINPGDNIPFVFDSLDGCLYHCIIHPCVIPNITKS